MKRSLFITGIAAGLVGLAVGAYFALTEPNPEYRPRARSRRYCYSGWAEHDYGSVHEATATAVTS